MFLLTHLRHLRGIPLEPAALGLCTYWLSLVHHTALYYTRFCPLLTWAASLLRSQSVELGVSLMRFWGHASGCPVHSLHGHSCGPAFLPPQAKLNPSPCILSMDAPFCGMAQFPGEKVLGQRSYIISILPDAVRLLSKQLSLLTVLLTLGYIFLPLMDFAFHVKSINSLPNSMLVRFSPMF